MTPIEEKTALLAMCSGLLIYVENAQKIQQGRLKGQLQKLKDQSDFYLANLSKNISYSYNYSHDYMIKFINRFDILAGWKQNQNHVLVYCNFLALLAEKHKYNQLNKSIIEIMDYFERADNMPVNGITAGIKAFNLWEDMI